MNVLKWVCGLLSPTNWLKIVGGLVAILAIYYFSASIRDRLVYWMTGKEIQKLEQQVEASKHTIDTLKETQRGLAKTADRERANARAAAAEVRRLEGERKLLLAKVAETETLIARVEDDVSHIPVQELVARIRGALDRLRSSASAPSPSN